MRSQPYAVRLLQGLECLSENPHGKRMSSGKPHSAIAYRAPRPIDREARITGIADAVANCAEATHYVPFRDGYCETPVAMVGDGLLLYRADNGRLFAELIAAGVSREQKGDAAQQQVLHELLLEKAEDPDGPIFDELERHAKQTEPLLIAADGVIVNGNRRLASMRELRARDPERFACFATIMVAVLPDTLTHEDMEFIETALQLAPDLKLDYSWTNRRLKLRDHVERLPMGEEAILAAYRFDDASAIDRELAELALAESYMRYAGAPGDYALVAGLEEPLTAMHRELNAFENRKVVELWTFAGFAMLHARESLARPIEQYFPFARPVPFETVHWVLRSLAEQEDVIEPQAEGENRPVDQRLADQLEPLLRDVGQAESLAAEICALSDRLRADAGRAIGAAQALSYLGKATKSLQDLDPTAVSAKQSRQIRARLLVLLDYIDAYAPSDNDNAADNGKKRKGMLDGLFGRS